MIYVIPRIDEWQEQPSAEPASASDYTLEFPVDRYPETAKHIQEAMASGESKICTIDRENAEENRKESLKDIPTKKGYDRDEWPMAMCQEGGDGADIAYISPSDNRGAGAWVSNQLDTFPDGTRVEFIVK
ncbi:NucA/NucB deoxyribonuclease domain-containing protein [Paenibacillus glycanilyticus]|nr:NucA/NucB deoxyribonuclease domain-containing protein [Paenibacillus glycanilyticus]